jgi:diamine N-acetyltransferase
MLVTLREITAKTVRQITRLSVSADQQRLVASSAISLAGTLFSEDAWYRAIYVDATAAGFVMLYDESIRARLPGAPDAGLWRFMIDAGFQRRGVGRAALTALIAHVRGDRCFSSPQTSPVSRPRLSRAVPPPLRLQAHRRDRRRRNRARPWHGTR